jgi:hypothetical protein
MAQLARALPLFDVAREPDEYAAHGEVHTRRWVVELILDLIGYRAARNLADLRVVEPACGHGAFLEVITRRLSESCRVHQRSLIDAAGAVRAMDLLQRNVDESRHVVRRTLARDGWDPDVAAEVANLWVRQGDYLLDDFDRPEADLVVGNPPYIRLEDIPIERMRLYRHACRTMTGRADIYVGFFEVALASLRSGGKLGFICADRWMRNQYGRDLRRLVSRTGSVDVVVSMHDVDAFHDQVSAYPAISVLRKGKQGPAIVVQASRGFDAQGATELGAWVQSQSHDALAGRGFVAARLPVWFSGDDLWPAASPARLTMIEQLNDRFAALGDPASGVRIGIGVATGADTVFITRDPDLVEPARLLPLAMAGDTKSGNLEWSGNYLVNPWDDSGRLVSLDAFPRLANYLTRHADVLGRRHVGRRQPTRWYRTIDKVDARLTALPKLLLPDMKITSQPVLDEGGHYPHHNLYYVVSDSWDLRVLGGLLLSKVAEAFVDAYAVKMRGGTLRFQAQYLRRIRVPARADVTVADRRALAEAFERRDADAATAAALRVYGLGCLPD